MTATFPCPSEMAFSLRATEPDVFHSMVKMHLSFLLDLNTDDCDCSFIMDPAMAATPSKSNNGDKDSLAKRIFTPKKFLSSGHQSMPSSYSTSSKGVMDGATLTMEGVCQVFQLVDYLRAERNLITVGIFRKHGNLRKQQALKERLNRGVVINLDDGEFSVHECAAVLKSFLADLPEPLLTDACYKAHCQVARLVGKSQDSANEEQVREKCVACLQLLFLLIPQPNYNFLKDLLSLLKKVASMEETNKMSSANLGTMFAPLILCPRRLSAESLQSNHQLLTRAVAYMIDNADAIFELPSRLHNDIDMYLKNKANRPKPAVQAATPLKGVGPDGKPQSPVVNTIYSFVDKEKTNMASSQTSTEAALAELYAHVQSMPESAQKRKLVAKLNDANGQGTPGVHKGGFRKRNDGIKSLLTPKRSSKRTQDEGKIGRHGSYNLQADFKTPGKAPSQLLHSFRRQKSESAGDEEQSKLTQSVSQKLLSPQSSPALLVSPSTIDTIVQKQEIKHSGKETVENPPEVEEAAPNLDGSYVAPPPFPSHTQPLGEKSKKPPPVPERVSSLNCTKADGASEEVNGVSPISCYARTMPSDMQKSIMTPRSRRPVQVAPEAMPEEDEEEKAPPRPPLPAFLPPESPCTSSKYNEDEPQQEEPKQIQSNDPESEAKAGHSQKSKNRAYTSRSLQQEFQAYLQSNNIALETSTCTNNDESSILDSSAVSSVSREADKILSGEMQLSDSMREVLDGKDPGANAERCDEEKNKNMEPVTPSVLVPVDIDSALALSDITEEGDDDERSNKENDSYISAKSHLSSYSTASTLPCQDIPLPAFMHSDQVSTSTITISYPNNENKVVESGMRGPSSASRSRKRRSLTEISELNPMANRGKNSSPAHNIYFETDL